MIIHVKLGAMLFTYPDLGGVCNALKRSTIGLLCGYINAGIDTDHVVCTSTVHTEDLISNFRLVLFETRGLFLSVRLLRLCKMTRFGFFEIEHVNRHCPE